MEVTTWPATFVYSSSGRKECKALHQPDSNAVPHDDIFPRDYSHRLIQQRPDKYNAYDSFIGAARIGSGGSE